MPPTFLEPYTKGLPFLTRWWLFWLGYAFLPALIVSGLAPFTQQVGDVNFWQLLVRLLLLIGLYFSVSKTQQIALKTTVFQPLTLPDYLKIVGLFFGMLLVGVLVFSVIEYLLPLPIAENSSAVGTMSLLQLSTVVVLAPVVEETWFRHLLLSPSVSTETRPPWLGFIHGWGDVFSVVIFGLLHFSPSYEGCKAFAWALMMGLFLLWVRRTTGSLTACIALHALHNGLLVFF
jgi:membrane protease YdiL (CAAX protease family)